MQHMQISYTDTFKNKLKKHQNNFKMIGKTENA